MFTEERELEPDEVVWPTEDLNGNAMNVQLEEDWSDIKTTPDQAHEEVEFQQSKWKCQLTGLEFVQHRSNPDYKG